MKINDEKETEILFYESYRSVSRSAFLFARSFLIHAAERFRRFLCSSGLRKLMGTKYLATLSASFFMKLESVLFFFSLYRFCRSAPVKAMASTERNIVNAQYN